MTFDESLPSYRTTTTRIVAWCASHIETLERLIYWKIMVRSWFRQTCSCRLMISMSCEPHIRDDVTAAIAEAREEYNDLTVYFQSDRLTQFQHYSRLADTVTEDDEAADDTWILFTDDDDVWSPHRVSLYDDALQTSLTNGTAVDFIAAGWYAMQSTLDTQAVSPEEAQNMIGKQQAHSINAEPKDVTYLYAMWMVPRKKIAEWTRTAADSIIKNDLADLFWMKHVASTATRIGLTSRPTSWLYYYRSWSADQQTRGHGIITPDDEKDIRTCCAKMIAWYFTQHDRYSRQRFKQFCRSQKVRDGHIKAMQRVIDDQLLQRFQS